MQNRIYDAVESIMGEHSEYFPLAYHFVYEAFTKASEQNTKSKGKGKKKQGLTSEDFYYAIVNLALERFGPLAGRVFSHWGIENSSQIGEIIYLLIDEGIFQKQEGDSKEQFDNLPDLEKLFSAPYSASADSAS